MPASLRSDFIHIPGTLIHIALESTIHIVGIRTSLISFHRLLPLTVEFLDTTRSDSGEAQQS